MDASTIAAIGTAVGTLVLGLATFASVRSANRAARVAERSLLLGQRPILSHARPEDPPQEILYGDWRNFTLSGEEAIVEVEEGTVYLAFGVRNVGSGLALLQSYNVLTDLPAGPFLVVGPSDHGLHDRGKRRFPTLETFRVQQRDLYVAPGDGGYWQSALRDPEDPMRQAVVEAVGEEAKPISVDLLYADYENAQHMVSRFQLVPAGSGRWTATAVFHWNVEKEGQV
jgi:hypothetical protein